MGYLGEFEQMFLYSVVELGDDAFGGAIRETIERRTGRLVPSGSIYTALGRLSARNLVSSRVGEPTAGRAGRPRKYYSIEPAGAQALMSTNSTIQAMAGGLTSQFADLAGS